MPQDLADRFFLAIIVREKCAADPRLALGLGAGAIGAGAGLYALLRKSPKPQSPAAPVAPTPTEPEPPTEPSAVANRRTMQRYVGRRLGEFWDRVTGSRT